MRKDPWCILFSICNQDHRVIQSIDKASIHALLNKKQSADGDDFRLFYVVVLFGFSFSTLNEVHIAFIFCVFSILFIELRFFKQFFFHFFFFRKFSHFIQFYNRLLIEYVSVSDNLYYKKQNTFLSPNSIFKSICIFYFKPFCRCFTSINVYFY
jgi:hypothetical protein